MPDQVFHPAQSAADGGQSGVMHDVPTNPTAEWRQQLSSVMPGGESIMMNW